MLDYFFKLSSTYEKMNEERSITDKPSNSIQTSLFSNPKNSAVKNTTNNSSNNPRSKVYSRFNQNKPGIQSKHQVKIGIHFYQ